MSRISNYWGLGYQKSTVYTRIIIVYAVDIIL